FLTDFLLVPSFGLRGTQLVAVFFNVVAALGAFAVARNVRPATSVKARAIKKPNAAVSRSFDLSPSAVPLTALAIAMAGVGAMGMEILWFRHVSILLGGFRAVFSLLMTVVLAGIGA